VRERDRIGRAGIFIAEGATVLTVFVRAPVEAIAILVEEERAGRLPQLAFRGSTPLFLAPQAVLDAIAGFHIHRGILAAGRIPAPSRVEDLPDGPLRLPVLVGLSNHDNVGGVYRNAAAFAAAAAAVDGTTADPFYRKAIRVGVGAPLLVPTIRTDDPAALVEHLRSRGVTPYALAPRAPLGLGAARLAPRAAFLLGTEGPGLPDALLESATPLAIPIAPGFDSLNVATASGIILHAHAAQHGLGPDGPLSARPESP